MPSPRAHPRDLVWKTFVVVWNVSQEHFIRLRIATIRSVPSEEELNIDAQCCGVLDTKYRARL